MCPTYICIDFKFCQEFRFNIIQGQLRSSEVKFGSNLSNYGQIVPISRNISNIRMFRLRILSGIEIKNYLRSNQVIKSHQRSNLGQTCLKKSNRETSGEFIVYLSNRYSICSKFTKIIVNSKWIYENGSKFIVYWRNR